jgi:hypothetical protein
MKIALWIVFAVLAVVWTGGALLTVELVRWGAQALASGGAAELADAANRLPVPAWLAPWVDPDWVRALREGIAWTLQAARDALPFLGTAMGWLVPLVWIAWVLGFLALLAVAAVLNGLLGGRRRPEPPGPAAPV